MIGIVNLNMSLDKIYMVDSFEKGEVTRVKKVINMAGGKGTHVANICHELSIPYKLIGFIAGETGNKIKELLNDDHMNYKFIEVPGDSRTCLNIISQKDKGQTEFLESGPIVSSELIEKFLDEYKRLCKESNVIVISGSGYKNMDKTFYYELSNIAKNNDCYVIVDTSGEALLEAIKSQPYAIKPNIDEVKALSKTEDSACIIKELLNLGITMPIISKGALGAIAGYSNKIYEIRNPIVTPVNCVGSGDSFIGGLAIGLHEGYSIENTLKLACACGTANTLQLASGKIAKDDVNLLLKEIKVVEK